MIFINPSLWMNFGFTASLQLYVVLCPGAPKGSMGSGFDLKRLRSQTRRAGDQTTSFFEDVLTLFVLVPKHRYVLLKS